MEPFTQKSGNEESLRRLISKRPRNGRARAQLALLLHRQAKEEHNDKSKRTMNLEALKLATESIQVAPTKPFGYVAKSILVETHNERVSAIRQAIQILQDNETESYQTTRLELMIRLLIEPRRHKNEMRRRLDKSEEELYETILDAFRQINGSNDNDRTNLGQCHYRLGTLFRKMNPPTVNQPRARQHFSRALDLLPASHRSCCLSQFWLATLDDSDEQFQPTKCPPDYIVGLYSTFASRFDELLVKKLNYQTPTLLRQLVNECLHSTTLFDRAVDLGCGTGLSGMAFCDIVGSMIGVDLSLEMIDKARERNLYDKLVVGDVTVALNDTYDLVFSCDVLVYIGDLEQVFSKVYKSLSIGGVFCFSTEALDDETHTTRPYRLHECARFAHKPSYILSLARQHGFRVIGKRSSPIRKNKGKDVNGFLVVLQKR